MRYILTVCCLLFTASLTRAEDNDTTQVEINNNILFFKDPRVDVLQKMYMRNNDAKKQAIRVQVFQATSRDKVFEAKSQFSARYPGIPIFISYSSPNFKLRVGDFATQQEAFKFMQQLKSYFPASFVIEEKAKDEDEKPKAKKGN